jgi:hypothetical protein
MPETNKKFPSRSSDPKAVKIIDGLEVIQRSRYQHDAAVKETTHFILPRKSDIRDINTISSYNGGELAAYANLFTRAGRSANQGMASGISSYTTPKNRKWFKITTGDRDLDENLNVYKYFDQVRDTMLDLLARSNFNKISHETYLNLGAIGTSCTMTEWDKKENGLMFTDFPYNTFWFTEDDKQRPNRVYREFVFTGEQAVEKWGEDALEKCSSVMTAYYSSDPDNRREQFKFVHLVEPNKNQIVGNIDDTGKGFKSTYICKDDKQVIVEEGLEKLPYKITRFLTYNTQGNVMGYSPAMDCMPIVKTLENFKKKFILAVEKNLNPAMSRGVSVGMVPPKVRSSPNALNNFDSRNPESAPRPLLQSIDLSYTLAELEDEVKQIEDAFHIPTFQTITNIDKSNATATEIIARQQEALVGISPSISNIEDEFLEPILNDTFDFAQEHNLLPEPPIELEEGALIKLEFTGVLSSAHKLAESVAGLSYFQEIGSIMQFMPEEKRVEIMNSHNWYQITKDFQENRNLPANWRFSREEVEEETNKQMAAQRAAQQEQAMMDAAGKQDLNQTPEEGSVMAGVV